MVSCGAYPMTTKSCDIYHGGVPHKSGEVPRHTDTCKLRLQYRHTNASVLSYLIIIMY